MTLCRDVQLFIDDGVEERDHEGLRRRDRDQKGTLKDLWDIRSVTSQLRTVCVLQGPTIAPGLQTQVNLTTDG